MSLVMKKSWDGAYRAPVLGHNGSSYVLLECPTCRAVVLLSSADEHQAWHDAQKISRARAQGGDENG